jgi:hypothetical protein
MFVQSYRYLKKFSLISVEICYFFCLVVILLMFVFNRYPNLKSVRELIYKRGFAKIHGQRIPITSNKIIEEVSLLDLTDLHTCHSDQSTSLIFSFFSFFLSIYLLFCQFTNLIFTETWQTQYQMY